MQVRRMWSGEHSQLRRHNEAVTPSVWHRHSFCATQCASAVSDAHVTFYRASLVELLGHAIESGFEIDALNERRERQSLDASVLLGEKMFLRIAAPAAALRDGVGALRSPPAAISHGSHGRILCQGVRPAW